MKRPLSGVVEGLLSLHGGAALALLFMFTALEAPAFIGLVLPGELAWCSAACSRTLAGSRWPGRLGRLLARAALAPPAAGVADR